VFPDFHKNRIACFDLKGKLVKALAVKEGISPRMNYFSLAPKERYVTFGGYTLYLIGSDGSLIWKRQFGYGAIPENLFANDVGIFLVLPGGDGKAIVFDYVLNRPLGKYGFTNGEDGVPMIRTCGKGNFTFRLSEIVIMPESGFPKGGFHATSDAFLVYVDSANKSLWKKKSAGGEELFLFSATGTPLEKLLSFTRIAI
jgi:hypothetical protein